MSRALSRTGIKDLDHPIASSEVYEAIVQLLQGQGVYHAHHNVVVGKVITSAGQLLYVVVSTGMERCVLDAITSSVIAPKRPGGHETLLLYPDEVGELVRKAQRRFF
jgi:hypothetical protein